MNAKFEFASVGNIVTVEDRGRGVFWRMEIEVERCARVLHPLRDRMTRAERRLYVQSKREALVFAVAEARARDLID